MMDNENPLKKQKNKTIGMVEDSQTSSGNKDVDELTQTVEDVPSDENWVEEKEGKIAPVENAGSTEIPVTDDMRKRFAKTHDFDPATMVTGQKSSGKHNFGKTDKPADTTPADE